MNAPPLRMTGRENPPSDVEVRAWIGEESHPYWLRVTDLIDQLYPGIFAAEWLCGGQKHGWSLRYKKSRPLCTLIPERGRFLVLVVFGAAERERVEELRDSLSRRTAEDYDAATTYHDGKWVVLTVDSDAALEDLVKLWTVKRKPRAGRRQSSRGAETAFQIGLIAPCGMDCALCLAYLREKNRCVGCRGDDDAKPKYCAVCVLKTCERRTAGMGDYCFNCDGKYPCARLKRLDHRYRTKYGMSMLDNLDRIRSVGVEGFLADERQRWTCAECGGVICVHRKNCLHCGHPIEHTPA